MLSQVQGERSDAELVALLTAGRQEALAALYDRYAPLLMAVGIRIVANRLEVEDVLHDVFVEAWRTASQYDAARGTVRAWLVTRMRSRCLDRQKSAVVSRSVPIENAGPEMPAPPLDPFRGEDTARLRSALDALPVEQRVVLELGYFDGLSCTEIAARIGVPVGTVKSRTAAALGKLRGSLGEGGAS
jgi:RNA polymerase sigma-70 factor (ECF subfamily)